MKLNEFPFCDKQNVAVDVAGGCWCWLDFTVEPFVPAMKRATLSCVCFGMAGTFAPPLI